MATQVERLREARDGHVKHVVRGDFATLDALTVEALGVFCWSDVKPLAGPAGFLDWRLCGSLSRTFEKGLFEARRSEVMLTPAQGRLHVRRLFVFGLGPMAEATLVNMRHACRRAFEVMTLAGVDRLVFAAPAARQQPELELSFLRALDEELPGRLELVLVEHAS